MMVKSMFVLSLTHLKLWGLMERIRVSCINLQVSISVITCIVLKAILLPEDLFRPTLRFVLIALDYLHEAEVIHTGKYLI